MLFGDSSGCGKSDGHGRFRVASAMTHDGKHGKLGVALSLLDVGNDGNAVRTDDERYPRKTAAKLDGLRSPASGSRVRRDDDEHKRALKTSSGADRVYRPREPFAGIFLELRFDDDPEHRLAIEQKHDRIGVVLDGNELVERSLGKACLGEFRHVNRGRWYPTLVRTYKNHVETIVALSGHPSADDGVHFNDLIEAGSAASFGLWAPSTHRLHIAAYILGWNKDPTPFIWKPAAAIIRSHRGMLARIS
jgi:hypothetical protein